MHTYEHIQYVWDGGGAADWTWAIGDVHILVRWIDECQMGVWGVRDVESVRTDLYAHFTVRENGSQMGVWEVKGRQC